MFRFTCSLLMKWLRWCCTSACLRHQQNLQQARFQNWLVLLLLLAGILTDYWELRMCIDWDSYFGVCISTLCQSQWTSCLRRGSVATLLLGLRVRIPLVAWMFVSCECCVLSSRYLCEEADPLSIGVLPTVLCHCVIQKLQDWGGPGSR
jgi:hypothetical protein